TTYQLAYGCDHENRPTFPEIPPKDSHQWRGEDHDSQRQGDGQGKGPLCEDLIQALQQIVLVLCVQLSNRRGEYLVERLKEESNKRDHRRSNRVDSNLTRVQVDAEHDSVSLSTQELEGLHCD